MLKEQIRTEIARIINASCIDPPTREEPDRPINCHADCGLCKADQILALFPQGEGGHWLFKADKLTPLQVKATVCQQCPFYSGNLDTKCDWCDNWKLLEFLELALPAIDDFYQQHEALALKAQMERVIRVIDRRIAEQERVFDLAVRAKTNAKLQVLKALKAELEGEGLVLELGCHYLNSEFECEKGLLINSKCPNNCIYYDDGSR